MAYKKYIRRNGKLYGPYVYHSKRVDGKVVSEYRGVQKFPKLKNKKVLALGISLAFILILIIWGAFFSFRLTGQVTDQFDVYTQGDILYGKFNLLMKSGELIPVDSRVILQNGGEEFEYSLSELVGQGSVVSNYYFDGSELSGTGEGYGFIGYTETLEPVFFKLEISPTSESTEGSGGSGTGTEAPVEEETPEEVVEVENETVIEEPVNDSGSTGAVLEETTNETPALEETSPEETISGEETISEGVTEEPTTETPTGETGSEEVTSEEEAAPAESSSEDITTESSDSSPDSSDSDSESSSEESSESASPITGNIISNLFLGLGNFFATITGNVVEEVQEIQGDVVRYETFTENVPADSEVRILPGSVRTEETELLDSAVTLVRDGNTVEVTTNYSIRDEGFGESYFVDEDNYLVLDFGQVGLILEEGPVMVQIEYGNLSLISFEGAISLEEEPVSGETLNETNVSINESFEETVEEVFNDTNLTIEGFDQAFIINLTESEKGILMNEFGLIVVNTQAQDYRDKVIVTFTIGDYSVSNAYPLSLNEETLDNIISRDRILWLKDISRELSKESLTYTPREDLNSMDTII